MFSLLQVSKTQQIVRPGKTFVHLQRFSKLFDSLIILTSMVEHPSKVVRRDDR